MIKKKNFKIKFVHIDYENRPIFKVLGHNYYLCDTGHLFRKNTSENEIKEFYNDLELKNFLEYYGTSSECEPEGGEIEADLILT